MLKSSKPLWMLLERLHANTLLGRFQETLGDVTSYFIRNNLINKIHACCGDWNEIKIFKDNVLLQDSCVLGREACQGCVLVLAL